jgi:hypothetical protein
MTKKLKDRALIGVAGLVALALLVTSGIIPWTSASETPPVDEPGVTTSVDGTTADDESGGADKDGSVPAQGDGIPTGPGVVRASFTVVGPD